MRELRNDADPTTSPDAPHELDARVETPPPPVRSPPPAVAQGSYLMAFSLAPQDVTAAVDTARDSLLPALQRECAPSSAVSGDGWRRVRGKKGSRVRLWEKGSGSSLTPRPGTMGVEKTPRDAAAAAVDREQNERVYAVRSSVSVAAPLDVVLRTLDCAHATSYRSFTKIIHEGLIADTSVLFHDHLSPELSTALAVRWLACRCARPLVADCDFCLVEYTRAHSVDELPTWDRPSNNDPAAAAARILRGHDGLRMAGVVPAAYKVFSSIETKFCPEFYDSHHVLRGRCPLGGYLLYPTEHSEITDVVFHMSLVYRCSGSERGPSGGGTTRPFTSLDDRQFRAMQHVLQQLAVGLGRLTNAVDAYRMGMRLERLRTTRWVENSDRSECVVCYRRFHPIARRRHHCRLCGDVICRDCSIHKDADLPTIGPTTLRICKLCNREHFSVATPGMPDALTPASSSPPGDGNIVSPDDDATNDRQTVRPRRRRATLAVEVPPKDVALGSPEVGASPARVRAISVQDPRHRPREQPSSCPKSSILGPPSVTDRWERPPTLASPVASPSSGRWSKAFFANRPGALSSHSPKMAPSRGFPRDPGSPGPASAQTHPLPMSCSKANTTAQRFNFGFVKSALRSPHMRPDHTHSPTTTHRSMAPRHPPVAGPLHIGRGPSSSPTSRGSDNQSPHDGSSGDITLDRVVRLHDVAAYEDLLGDLCDRARSAGRARFAAVSVFIEAPADAKPTSSMAHFMKPEGSPKLLSTTANMRCCEPVLQALGPVVTRNASTFSTHGCDLKSLPFVKGPQQARFYAGIPLVDSKNRLVGALAVFDPSFVDDEGELLDRVDALVAATRTCVGRIEDRHAEKALQSFMNVPLLRQSEPVLVGPKRAEDATTASEEELRLATRLTTVQGPRASPASTPKHEALEYYKRQMHRLVQQAHLTQDQVMQNAAAMRVQGY